MQWAEIHGINMGGFCLSFPAHPQDRGPSAGWSCRPRDRPSAACQSAWIRCGSPRWWGWRAVRTAGTIPRLARRLRIHCPGWRLLEIMNYWTRFPSICNEDYKIFANFYKLRNDSPCLCLPDWMTSSSVAPSLVFLSLSLSITSFVKYFFRREWQSDEACEFNLFMNESLYHHCLHQFHSRFFFFFLSFLTLSCEFKIFIISCSFLTWSLAYPSSIFLTTSGSTWHFIVAYNQVNHYIISWWDRCTGHFS